MEPPVRVVVTGMGAVAPLGSTCPEIFEGLAAGRSGVGRITQFDASGLPTKIAGEAHDFDPTKHMDRKLARRIGRFAQFAIAATQEAVAQARLDVASVDPSRVATVAGSAIGDFPILEEQIHQYFARGLGRTSPFTVPRVSTNMAAGNVSILLGATGPSFGTASACATGSHALATAWMLLRSGLADVAIAGGVESAITECFVASYNAMGALSTRNEQPERASRPFDRGRDGFVLGEGGAIFVLETLAHARARGAPVLAEFVGVGMSADAYHITASHPDGRGAAAAITSALHIGGVAPTAVDYIAAHGTSTPLNDPIETAAIKAALGEHAYRVALSSIKSMVGHCIAGAGPLGAMTCVMAIDRGVIPPTINLDDADPRCDLDYVPHTSRGRRVDVALCNAFAFGGQNCVLAFRRFLPEHPTAAGGNGHVPA